MVRVKVKKVRPDAVVPRYQTEHAAGVDLHAAIDATWSIPARWRRLIPTGLAMEIPFGFEAQVRPRSGLALKQGITVLNTPGTIDADYRGEVGVILFNTNDGPVFINPGDRIAQLVVAPVAFAAFIETEELSDTERGAGGFGHTGK